MTTRVRPESREELEARTKAMREKQRASGTQVKYRVTCTVEHVGMKAEVEGSRDGESSAYITMPSSVSQPIRVTESQIEPLIEFLKFLKEELGQLKEYYGDIEDLIPS